MPAPTDPPRALAGFDARRIAGLFTDIDDTLTTDGQLLPQAYRALCDLAQAGIAVVPVTGRSAGWAHMIVKTWPVRAVVAESGGLYLHRREGDGRLLQRYHQPEAQVRAARLRLAACADRVMAAVPGLAPASDNAYRLVDLALDYCEEVPRLPAAEVQRAIDLFHAAGFSARASSVHINAWDGQFDKAPMALQLLDDLYAGTPLADPDHWAFAGDAPNDASMFAAFEHSVAVANIAPHLHLLPARPAWITGGHSGAGFIELATHLLTARARSSR